MSSYVFKSYMYNLGLNNIPKDVYYDVYLIPVIITENTYLTSISNLKEKYNTNFKQIGQVKPFKIDTINNDTKMKSYATYEEVESFPASAYIFSLECPNNCWLRKDWEYTTIWDNHYSDRNVYAEDFNQQYWENTYSLSDTYDSTEYKIYNLPQTYLSEDTIVCSADAGNEIFYGKSEASNFGKGILIGVNDIPITFIEFDKTHNINKGVINIEWSTNGLMRLK